MSYCSECATAQQEIARLKSQIAGLDSSLFVATLQATAALRLKYEEQRKLLSAWQTVAMDLYEALPEEQAGARKQFVDLAENGEIPASRHRCEEQRKPKEESI